MIRHEPQVDGFRFTGVPTRLAKSVLYLLAHRFDTEVDPFPVGQFSLSAELDAKGNNVNGGRDADQLKTDGEFTLRVVYQTDANILSVSVEAKADEADPSGIEYDVHDVLRNVFAQANY